MDASLLNVGSNPNYWYPIARSASLGRTKTLALAAWGRHIVAYRDASGVVHALENRCLHRGVALDQGQVSDCDLVCPYHGWVYGCAGELKSIPYLAEKKRMPQLRLRSYCVREQGGLIWIFPGAQDRAAMARPPDTSVVETPEWMPFPIDHDFPNHFAIGVINGMDYFHFHLHRDYQPWRTIEVASVSTEGDSVHGVYDITSYSARTDRFFNWILGSRKNSKVTRRLKVHYFYPHHLAEVDDDLKVWVFFLPLRVDLVRVFITMYVRGRGMARVWRAPFRRLFSPLILRRIQAQDAFAGILEQAAWERHPDAPRCEVNPISVAVERLIREKWRDALAAEAQPAGVTPQQPEADPGLATN